MSFELFRSGNTFRYRLTLDYRLVQTILRLHLPRHRRARRVEEFNDSCVNVVVVL